MTCGLGGEPSTHIHRQQNRFCVHKFSVHGGPGVRVYIHWIPTAQLLRGQEGNTRTKNTGSSNCNVRIHISFLLIIFSLYLFSFSCQSWMGSYYKFICNELVIFGLFEILSAYCLYCENLTLQIKHSIWL